MTVAPNSLKAFDTVDMPAGQKRVLEAIRELHAANRRPCDQDVADYLGWTINRVTPRRGELFDQGRVVRAGDKPGRFGLRVAVWAPTPEQLSFWRALHESLVK